MARNRSRWGTSDGRGDGEGAIEGPGLGEVSGLGEAPAPPVPPPPMEGLPSEPAHARSKAAAHEASEMIPQRGPYCDATGGVMAWRRHLTRT